VVVTIVAQIIVHQIIAVHQVPVIQLFVIQNAAQQAIVIRIWKIKRMTTPLQGLENCFPLLLKIITGYSDYF
jgi:hypothetical protein